jgi:PAS domain S-box-containing protein
VRYRLLVEGAKDHALFLLDPLGQVSSWNAGAERMAGYPAGEAIGRHLADLYPPEGVARGEPGRALEAATVEGRSEDEGWRVRKDGTRFWAHTVIDALVDDSGRLLGFATVVSDLTRRKQSDEVLRSVLENVLDGIITIDERGTIQSFNPAAERVFAYRAAEVLGRNISMLMPEPYHGEHDSYLANYLRTGHKKIIGVGREVVGRRSDGTTFPMDLAVSEFRLNDRRFFTGIVRDITERKRLERELRHRLAELAEADRRKDEFLAMLSHELRNPLAAISGAFELLESNGDPEQAAWSMEVIDRQVAHLSRLVDDLLDVSRITRGKIRLRRRVVDVAGVMQGAVEAVRPLLDERRHRLRVSVAPGTMWLDVDPTRLEQVLSNLLGNAAKYTDAGGQVDFSASLEGGEVVIRVRDTGIGIPADQLSQVFELFAQGDRTLARSEGGLGIGLTLARELTEMHGGTVSASSEGEGRGSEFAIRLPAAGRPEAADAPEGPPEGVPRHARVLIVEDNVDLARGLARFMRHLGYEVETVHDGPAALGAASSFRPEVVLLDIGLPGLDGYQVARQLRAEEYGRKARIIAVTGYGQEEDVRRSLEAGFDHHMIKPVTFKQLLGLLAGSAA